MPATEYKAYYLISRAHYDEKLRAWVPYASVVLNRDGDQFYYRQFMNLNSTFKAEEQALSYAFIFARSWVDEQLS